MKQLHPHVGWLVAQSCRSLWMPCLSLKQYHLNRTQMLLSMTHRTWYEAVNMYPQGEVHSIQSAIPSALSYRIVPFPKLSSFQPNMQNSPHLKMSPHSPGAPCSSRTLAARSSSGLVLSSYLAIRQDEKLFVYLISHLQIAPQSHLY